MTRRAPLWLFALALSACVPEPPVESPSDAAVDPGDARGSDAILGDAGRCVPEICDGLDNDCDGMADETFDLDTDARCGACDVACTDLPHVAFATCDERVCRIEPDGCTERYQDCDDDPSNGCETYCSELGEEGAECNGVDDDCDCWVDEGTGLESDAAHCGACGNACNLLIDQTNVACVDGLCAIESCTPGWFNPDAGPDGCRCRLEGVPEARRLTGGGEAPSPTWTAFYGDGSPGRVAWATYSGPDAMRQMTVFVRPMDAAGYWLGPATEAFVEVGDRLAVEGLHALGGGQFAVSYTETAGGELLWSRQIGEATSSLILDGCVRRYCQSTVVGGRLVGVQPERDGEPPTVSTRLRTTEGDLLMTTITEDSVPLERLSAMACRAPDDCAVIVQREATLRLARGGADVELERQAITPHLAVLGFGAEGLAAVWRRQGAEAPETVGALLGDGGQIVRGPAVLPIPIGLEDSTFRLIRDGDAGFVFFYARNANGDISAIHLRPDASVDGEPVSFPFQPQPANAAEMFHANDGRLAQFDGAITTSLAWSRPVAAVVGVESTPVEGELTNRLAFRGRGGVFLDVAGEDDTPVPAVGDAEPMLFTEGAEPDAVAIEAWQGGTLAVAAGRRGLRFAFVVPDQPVRRATLPWTDADGAPTTLEGAEVALSPWTDGTLLVVVTGQAGIGPIRYTRALAAFEDLAGAAALELAPERETAPRLAADSRRGGGLLLTAFERENVGELRVRRLDDSGQAIDPYQDFGRNSLPGHHDVVWAGGGAFIAYLDDVAASAPPCGRSVMLARCDDSACRRVVPGFGGQAGRDGQAGLALPAPDGVCLTGLSAVPNVSGGLTIAATAPGQTRLWLMELDAELRLVGEVHPWTLAGIPTWLRLIEGTAGAHAVLFRAAAFTLWLGCTR